MSLGVADRTGRVRRTSDALPEVGGAPCASDRQGRVFPISRWYILPIAQRVAGHLAPTRVRPTHLTLAGLGVGVSAAALLAAGPGFAPLAAALVLVAWFLDRTDGILARRQNTASAWGQWLDANVDELHDVLWHAGSACAAAALSGSQLPWFLLMGFLGGKYLFMTGLAEERLLIDPAKPAAAPPVPPGIGRWIHAAYHLPASADLRTHLLVAALATGLMTVELAVVAAYYNFRWIIRFRLVARRLGGCR